MPEQLLSGLQLGPLLIPAAVLTTWGIMALLVGAALLLTRRMRDAPTMLQSTLEGAVSAMEAAIGQVLPEQARAVLPFVGSLWVFVVLANLAGLIPGVASPTDDLSVTAALAVLVFFAVHWYGIRSAGLWGYLRHYVTPSPLLLPFHLISELTRTLALAVRLFGNMMSLELAALMILLVAGFLVPVPILMLHVVEALVQAYIFGMLALVYIAGAVQAREDRAGRAAETPTEH
jgi:F-type H+-transporting ATPase subunit a